MQIRRPEEMTSFTFFGQISVIDFRENPVFMSKSIPCPNNKKQFPLHRFPTFMAETQPIKMCPHNANRTAFNESATVDQVE